MIRPINTRVSCDLPDCKHTAVFAVQLKGRNALYLCTDCLGKLGEACNKLRTPKSPKNRIKTLSEGA